MKHLELRLATETEPAWRELVQEVAKAPPMNGNGQQPGFDVELMRKRLRISSALAALPDDATDLALEDSDAVELATALKGVRWKSCSQWVLDFCDAVAALPK